MAVISSIYKIADTAEKVSSKVEHWLTPHVPGTSTTGSHQHSSLHQRYQIHHSNWVRRTRWRAVSWRRIRNRLQRLGEHDIWGPCHASAKILRQHQGQMWKRHHGHFRSSQWYPCPDQTKGDRRVNRNRGSKRERIWVDFSTIMNWWWGKGWLHQ